MSSEYNLSYPFQILLKHYRLDYLFLFNNLNKKKLSINIIKHICA